METLLRGLHGVSNYSDDILVTGSTLEEHLQNLDAVLTRLEEAKLHLDLKKCSFLEPSLVYLGHKIDATGRHPTDEKITAIKEAPTP